MFLNMFSSMFSIGYGVFHGLTYPQYGPRKGSPNGKPDGAGPRVRQTGKRALARVALDGERKGLQRLLICPK